MPRKRKYRTVKDIVTTRLIKVNKEDVKAEDRFYIIDGELAYVIKQNLKSRIGQRRIKDYYIQTESDLINNNNIIAKYKKSYPGNRIEDVIICIFRISFNYVQENVIYYNKMVTNYYKIKFGGI